MNSVSFEAGRELDVAVARAMGCEPKLEIFERNGPMELWFCTCDEFNHTEGEGPFPLIYSYSTDPACVGEMLEWAASSGDLPTLRLVFDNPDWPSTEWWSEISDVNNKLSAMGKGNTPQLALARAILALQR